LRARVLLRRAAELDLAGIEDWYESQQAGLGAEIREAIDELFGQIGDNPLSFPERYRGSRRAILRRFPYIIWYRLQDDVAVVLACIHGSRNPRLVRARIREGG
jgi:toxin ParE1/3/4